jgi:hypothetical protein
MMRRVYRGRRLPNGSTVVTIDDVHALNNPDGLPWDWGASTVSFALARAVLADYVGAMPARSVTHAFAHFIVANFTDRQASWVLTTTEVDTAIAQTRASLNVQCLLCGDTGRREVVPRLWGSCSCRAIVTPATAGV